ncbi:hypothetical protein B0H14DRAFT_3706541 [Mycena olivaceomarginata]|nr:hypothetical protein B0H14DRAFT_3706541 [Mycena olivaceomarginata]
MALMAAASQKATPGVGLLSHSPTVESERGRAKNSTIKSAPSRLNGRSLPSSYSATPTGQLGAAIGQAGCLHHPVLGVHERLNMAISESATHEICSALLCSFDHSPSHTGLANRPRLTGKSEATASQEKLDSAHAVPKNFAPGWTFWPLKPASHAPHLARSLARDCLSSSPAPTAIRSATARMGNAAAGESKETEVDGDVHSTFARGVLLPFDAPRLNPHS